MKTPSSRDEIAGRAPRPHSIPKLRCYTHRIMRLRLVAGLVLIALTSGSVWLVWRTNGSAAALAAAARVVEIPAHAGILSIAASLGRAEVIESPTGFVLLSLTPGSARRLQAGEYDVEPGATMHQLLTLASIIEREAVARDEMRLVSAVFWNRLKLDMPLQADPTVQYAVGRERRALSRADLLTDHPYNTYRRVGLPPGPIASPGLPAIEAALDPAPVKYLYFVAMNDRRHYFSTTVEQHNAAVARYRLARER